MSGQSALEVFQLNKHSREEDLERCIQWVRDIFAEIQPKTISIVVKRSTHSSESLENSSFKPIQKRKDHDVKTNQPSLRTMDLNDAKPKSEKSAAIRVDEESPVASVTNRSIISSGSESQSVRDIRESEAFVLSETARKKYIAQNFVESLELYQQSQVVIKGLDDAIAESESHLKLNFQNKIYIGSIYAQIKERQKAIKELIEALELSRHIDVKEIQTDQSKEGQSTRESQKYMNSNPLFFIHLTLGNLFHEEKQLESAIEHLEAAYREIKDASSIIEQKSQALVLNTLGMVFYSMNDITSAIEKFKASLDIFAHLLTLPDNRNDPSLKTSYANRLNNLGEAYRRNKEIEQSIKNFEDSLKLKLEVQEETGDNSYEAVKSIASTHNNLGMSFFSKKKIDEAVQHLSSAVERYEVILEQSNEISDILAFANILNQRGDCWKAKQRYEEAINDYKRSYKMKVSNQGEENKSTLQTLNNYAQMLFVTKNYAKSKQAFMDLLRIQKIVYGQHEIQVAQTLNNIGTVLSENQEYEQAESIINDAIEIYSSKPGNEANLEKVQKNLAAIKARRASRVFKQNTTDQNE